MNTPIIIHLEACVLLHAQAVAAESAARETHDLRREVEALEIRLRNVARTLGSEMPCAWLAAEEAAEEAVAVIRDLRAQPKGGK